MLLETSGPYSREFPMVLNGLWELLAHLGAKNYVKRGMRWDLKLAWLGHMLYTPWFWIGNIREEFWAEKGLERRTHALRYLQLNTAMMKH